MREALGVHMRDVVIKGWLDWLWENGSTHMTLELSAKEPHTGASVVLTFAIREYNWDPGTALHIPECKAVLIFDLACWQALLFLTASTQFASSTVASKPQQLLGMQRIVTPAQQCSCHPLSTPPALSFFSYSSFFSLLFYRLTCQAIKLIFCV